MCAVAVAPLAYGQFQLTSFEPGQPISTGGGVVVDFGPGITDGLNALSTVYDPSNTYQLLARIDLNPLEVDFSQLTSIQADAHYTGSNLPDGFFNGLSAAVFTGTSGTPSANFNQLTGVQSPGGFFFGESPGGSQFIDVTWTLDPSDVQQFVDASVLDPAEQFSLEFFANKADGVTGTMVLDNIRLGGIPAPMPDEVLITSFEPDNAQPSGGSGVIVDTGPGITDGSFAASASYGPGSTYTGLTQVSLNQFDIDYTNATSIAVDFDYSGDPAGFTSLQPAFFFANGEGTEDDQFLVMPLASNGDANGFFVGDGSVGTGTEFTIDAATIDLLNAANDGDAGFNLGFYANSDSAASGTFVLDNIRILGAVGGLIDAAALAGDFDSSGSVEQGDLNLVLTNWGTNRTFEDGVTTFASDNVDQEELNVVLTNWGSSGPAPSFEGFAVPEPGALAVLSGLAVAGLRRRG
ncbi:MAG: hypothetical protein AAGJ38_08880 [Planctomycetota bacterium]